MVRKVGIQGKHKFADLWDEEPYIIGSQPIPDMPGFRVEKDNSTGMYTLLYRNILLPLHGLGKSFL